MFEEKKEGGVRLLTSPELHLRIALREKQGNREQDLDNVSAGHVLRWHGEFGFLHDHLEIFQQFCATGDIKRYQG
jgi:hypothetical protein